MAAQAVVTAERVFDVCAARPLTWEDPRVAPDERCRVPSALLDA